MKCRKCGSEIPDESIRCSNCGIKVNMYCPECKTLNPFGSKVCKSCGLELIKTCPECGANNLYSAKECRKCNYSFVDTEIEEKIITPEPKEFDVVRSFSSTEQAFIPVRDIEKNIEETENEKKEEFVNIFNVEEEEKEEEKVEEVLQYIEEESSEAEKPQVEQKDAVELDENVDVLPLEEDIDDSVKDSIQQENIEEEVPEDEETFEFEVQPEVVKKVANVIKTSITKQVIALQGDEGCGKTAVLKQVNKYLSSKGYLFLYGSCTPLVQITSFGFFQDAFLRIMGFPPYTKSTESFIKDFKKSNFYNLFNFLDGNELTQFLNIFYPSQNDNFENIMANKQQMFSILEKVIKSFSLNNNLVITIDNFELLDGASYDFIVHMMEKGYFNNRLKLLVAYQEDKSIQTYFDNIKHFF